MLTKMLLIINLRPKDTSKCGKMSMKHLKSIQVASLLLLERDLDGRR